MVLAAVAGADTTVVEVATLVAVAVSVEAEVLAEAGPQEAEAAAGVGNRITQSIFNLNITI